MNYLLLNIIYFCFICRFCSLQSGFETRRQIDADKTRRKIADKTRRKIEIAKFHSRYLLYLD